MKNHDAEATEYARGDDKFATWLEAVNKLVLRRYGVGLFDLPDMLTRDAFDAGTSPKEFLEDEVRTVVEEEFGYI